MNYESQFCSKSYGLTCKKTNSCKIINFYTKRKTRKYKKLGSVCCESEDYRFSENHTDPDPDPYPDYRPNPTFERLCL